MGYATGPYMTFESLPAPTVTRLHASRKIDFVTRRYMFDGDGNPLPQSSIAQVVALKVAFNVKPRKVITDQDLEAHRQDVLRSLAELMTPGAELIKRVSVVYERAGAGGVSGRVDFYNNSTGLDDSVEF